jgi:hypothetical protein
MPQHFQRHVAVGVDADVGRDIERLAHDGLGILVGVDQRPRCCQRVIAAGADGHHAGFRLEHVAGAGQHQRDVLVGDDHHGFQPAQIPVGAPVLGELDSRPGQLAGILLQFGFETLEQGEGVRRGAGKAADHVAACPVYGPFWRWI